MKDKPRFLIHFRKAQVKFSGIYAHILSREDLTLPQYALLNQLTITGPAAMSEAGSALMISKPAVTNLVDRLEEKGYLRRVAHPKDRRITLLEVKPRARRIVSRIQTHVFNVLFKTLERFSPRDREVIVKFYEALSGTLDNYSLKKGAS